MKKIKLVALVCAIVITATSLVGCGNMDMVGIGSYTFNKIHIDTYGYTGCVEIEKWIENERGVEVKSKNYGHLFFSEGTYIMVGDKCPVCDAKDLRS